MKIYEVEISGGHWEDAFRYTVARFDNVNDATNFMYEQMHEEEKNATESEYIQVREYNVGCEDIEGNAIIGYKRDLDKEDEFVLAYEQKEGWK